MKRMNLKLLICFGFAIVISACQSDQNSEDLKNTWHKQTRELRYRTESGDFIINNGTHRFNRALYGSNSGFRVEAGDLPEFAFYMPRMGGTLRLGLINGENSKWLIDCDSIEARYHAGTMTYEIKDMLTNSGHLSLQLLALPNADGMLLKITGTELPEDVALFWAFGGATGKRFSRDGDLGADPESIFYLKPENCSDNEYFIKKNRFHLYYGSGRKVPDNELYEKKHISTPEEWEFPRLKDKKRILGIVPPESEILIGDANEQEGPLQFLASKGDTTPAVNGKLLMGNTESKYILILNPDSDEKLEYTDLEGRFIQADSVRLALSERIRIKTPDKYINAVGSSLSTAADAVWDGKSFMHGAIAWRMPLNGWRGAYAADWLGWHDRAQTHFNGYFKAQYLEPAQGESTPDPKTHLARQKEEKGTALFTEGYISRSPGKINKPHHYDMNLVFIDQLLSHFQWTGDIDFLRKSWPVIERHLAWEKRNFDSDDNGLYDAYCCIWASDALQYSGGSVTHSSAYNYRANSMAAELAPLLGKSPAAYQAEADKILKAVNEQLWLPEKGWFAEYKDGLGNQLVHPSAALWTVYHAIDEGLADAFQAWQTTIYVDHHIPHIPIEAEGLPSGKYYTLSTSNWMPYTWSINSVALAEVLHTALAYWQAGRSEEAFLLAKSSFLDYQFMGTSPGNFGQLSGYDAFRGELYRDFADPTGMASRAMIEGLYGIKPDVLNNTLIVKPGWPKDWAHTSIETPDLSLRYTKVDQHETYTIDSHFQQDLKLSLQVIARTDKVKSVMINGRKAEWKLSNPSIGSPLIEIVSERGHQYTIDIEWEGEVMDRPQINNFYALNDSFVVTMGKARIIELFDPQKVFTSTENSDKTLSSVVGGELGWRTAFIQLQQGQMTWWQPVTFEVRNALDMVASSNQKQNQLGFSVVNNTGRDVQGSVQIGENAHEVSVLARSSSSEILVSSSHLVPGTNRIELSVDSIKVGKNLINWNVAAHHSAHYEMLDMSLSYNDRITNIFKEQYISPRAKTPTLSIPIQGIGDWCSYKETEDIDDSGLRKVAGSNNRVLSPQGIPLSTPGDEIKNILFTSQWDNYPDSVALELEGNASHLYLLMAGTVHHMQINMTNAVVQVRYADGSIDELPLVSPDNWWPIEQDYYQDGLAFQVNGVQPPRLYLKTGEWHLDSYDILTKNKTIKIDGGAASLLDMPLNKDKELKSVSLKTLTNDLVIGLMAVTVKR